MARYGPGYGPGRLGQQRYGDKGNPNIPGTAAFHERKILEELEAKKRKKAVRQVRPGETRPAISTPVVPGKADTSTPVPGQLIDRDRRREPLIPSGPSGGQRPPSAVGGQIVAGGPQRTPTGQSVSLPLRNTAWGGEPVPPVFSGEGTPDESDPTITRFDQDGWGIERDQGGVTTWSQPDSPISYLFEPGKDGAYSKRTTIIAQDLEGGREEKRLEGWVRPSEAAKQAGIELPQKSPVQEAFQGAPSAQAPTEQAPAGEAGAPTGTFDASAENLSSSIQAGIDGDIGDAVSGILGYDPAFELEQAPEEIRPYIEPKLQKIASIAEQIRALMPSEEELRDELMRDYFVPGTREYEQEYQRKAFAQMDTGQARFYMNQAKSEINEVRRIYKEKAAEIQAGLDKRAEEAEGRAKGLKEMVGSLETVEDIDALDPELRTEIENDPFLRTELNRRERAAQKLSAEKARTDVITRLEDRAKPLKVRADAAKKELDAIKKEKVEPEAVINRKVKAAELKRKHAQEISNRAIKDFKENDEIDIATPARAVEQAELELEGLNAELEESRAKAGDIKERTKAAQKSYDDLNTEHSELVETIDKWKRGAPLELGEELRPAEGPQSLPDKKTYEKLSDEEKEKLAAQLRKQGAL